MRLNDIQVGDGVLRMFGANPFQKGMMLRVTEVTDTVVRCGDWVFSRATGGEIDDDLGWDGVVTGSYISAVSRTRVRTP